MEGNWLLQIQQQQQIAQIVETNQITEKFGIVLSEQDARCLVEQRNSALQEQRRIEFGKSIIPKIIQEFCDSAYIDQGNFVETIGRLQEIFFLYKNEMMDEITDDELLHFMKEQFETICYGDLEYLEGTCLSNFAHAIRAGYRGYSETDGYGEYSKFDEVKRWDYELYLEAIKDLCWR